MHVFAKVDFESQNRKAIVRQGREICILQEKIMTETTTELTKDNFDDFTRQEGLVLIDFWAPWCGPCHALAPVLDSVAKKMVTKAKVGKMNVDGDNAQFFSARYNVRSIPTLIFIKDGQVVDTHVGLLSEEELVTKIKAHAK
ncbi:MAG: thioredoxin [Puniceicoccales bacterium]|nr:thioredoxin [Puniceicoccales bacterium]